MIICPKCKADMKYIDSGDGIYLICKKCNHVIIKK